MKKKNERCPNRLKCLVRCWIKRATRQHRFMMAQSKHNAKGRTLTIYGRMFSDDDYCYAGRVWLKNQTALDRVGEQWKLIKPNDPVQPPCG